MTDHPHFHIDLQARAYRAMLDEGFEPNFSANVRRQLQEIEREPLPDITDTEVRDLRSLLWSSIDNLTSRDLDQVEVAEQLANGDIRVLVGIADVDSRVPEGSSIDHHAAANTTSVYTGVATFPMLPEELSTGITSLNENED